MAELPQTREELEELISDYMLAHLSEQMDEVTREQIAEAVAEYMQNYGAAVEDNGIDGDVPLISDASLLDADNMSVLMARLNNGMPVSYLQAQLKSLFLAVDPDWHGGEGKTIDRITLSGGSVPSQIASGATGTFVRPIVTAYYNDGTAENVTNSAIYDIQCSAGSISGLTIYAPVVSEVTTVTITIRATYNGKTATDTMTYIVSLPFVVSCTINYNINGGSGYAPASITVDSGTTIQLAPYNGTKANNTAGNKWIIENQEYDIGADYTVNNDVTANYKWIPDDVQQNYWYVGQITKTKPQFIAMTASELVSASGRYHITQKSVSFIINNSCWFIMVPNGVHVDTAQYSSGGSTQIAYQDEIENGFLNTTYHSDVVIGGVTYHVYVNRNAALVDSNSPAQVTLK